MLYHINLEQPSILVRFQLDLLVSGSRKCCRDSTQWILTFLELKARRHLGEVELGIVLWKKKYINFPDSAPRPPTPLFRNSPQQIPPSSPDDWEPTARPSPAPSRQPTAAPISNFTKLKLFTSSPIKKRARKPKKVKAPEKLAGEMTMEELELSTQGKAKAFFEQKKGKTVGKT